MTGRNYAEVFERFRRMKILVVGDVMVDAYIFGKVERISPEAPVPVVAVEKRLSRLGGAANVALNLKALGAEPVLCTVVGNDPKGQEFMQLLREAGISPDSVVQSPSRITTTKFRIIGNKTQMLRVDEEMTGDLNEIDHGRLLEAVSNAIQSGGISAIIIQDYNKGVLNPVLIRQIITMAKASGIPVAVDPKRKNFLQFQDATLFKPNLKEMREGLNLDIQPGMTGSLDEAAAVLHASLRIEMVMTTLSEAGIFVSRKKKGKAAESRVIPAHIRNVADVSGAGDTVISVATLGLAAGLEAAEIAALSNLAGGLVCEEVGVVPVKRERLLEEASRLGAV
jgi:rfaE bifunctional protein kinase chain/domain